jgi:prepilin-type processing-associated H-X9-DG protein
MAIGEFAHHSLIGDYSEPPGNIRPWILSSTTAPANGSYVMKSVQFPINLPIDRSGGAPFNYLPFGSFHAVGGAHFLFVDGSVHFLNDDISFDIYQNMATVADGESAASI